MHFLNIRLYSSKVKEHMKDIADDATEYIKNRLGEVIEEHCKSLEACISALGDAVTVKEDKPDRKAKSPSKEAQ